MFKINKKIIITIVSILISYLLFNKISQQFFFDQLYFNKSIKYGYWAQGQKTQLSDFKERSKDLINLEKIINENNKEENNNDKNKENFKIAIIGDSHVWGQGLKFNDTVSQLLEKKLNKYKKTEVLAFGMPGDSVLDYLLRFNDISQNYDIDLYIFLLVDNDLLIKQDNKELYSKLSIYNNCKDTYPDLSATFDFKEQTFIDIKKDVSSHTAEEINQEQIEDFKKSWNNPINICILNETINQLPTANSIYLVSQYYADSDQNWDTYIDTLKKSNKNIIYMSKSKDINTYKKYWSNPEKYFQVSQIEGHPSYIANKIWTDLLFEEIIKNQ